MPASDRRYRDERAPDAIEESETSIGVDFDEESHITGSNITVQYS